MKLRAKECVVFLLLYACAPKEALVNGNETDTDLESRLLTQVPAKSIRWLCVAEKELGKFRIGNEELYIAKVFEGPQRVTIVFEEPGPIGRGNPGKDSAVEVMIRKSDNTVIRSNYVK